MAVALAAVAGSLAQLHAADITLTTSNALGSTSFNTSLSWSNGLAPGSGNNYFQNGLLLRTPPDANNYTFQGDSLTITGAGLATNEGNDALLYKGSASSTITVNNLTVNGGQLRQAQSESQTYTLGGSLVIGARGATMHVQGPMIINAPISGSGPIRILDPDNNNAARVVTFASGANTFTGNIQLFSSQSRFVLANTGNLKFVIGASGVNNTLSGAGIANLNGVFQFDLSGAGTTLGSSWPIVSAANKTFGSTFSIADGFVEFASGQWMKGIYQFSEATGILSVAPPPDLLKLRVNTSNGDVTIVNDEASVSFDMNYYEIRSPSGSLRLSSWTSIDGNIPPSTTSWEKLNMSSATRVGETNLLGMESFAPGHSVFIGQAYGGTLPSHEDLQFYYLTPSGGATLYRGYVEFFEGLLGDYNIDGTVDAADYIVWQKFIGAATIPNRGVGITGNVGLADYNFWRSRFGATVGTGGGGDVASAEHVPEAGSASLIIFSLATLTFGIRKRAF